MSHHLGRYLREADLRAHGVAEVGANVAVHETCVLVGLQNMRFGDNVRVDPYAVLTATGGGSLRVGSFVHLSAHLFLSASAGVEIGDFVALSVGTKVFTRSDDYTGEWMTNPTVPAEFTWADGAGPVRIHRHVIVGAGTIILPQVEIGEGAAIGAGSLVKQALESWTIHAGSPSRPIRPRLRGVLEHEARLRAALAAGEVSLPVASLGGVAK